MLVDQGQLGQQQAAHLVEVSTQQCPQHCGWLHDEDEVPVNERAVKAGVPPDAVGNKIGQGAAQDGDIGQRNCLRGSEAWNHGMLCDIITIAW